MRRHFEKVFVILVGETPDKVDELKYPRAKNGAMPKRERYPAEWTVFYLRLRLPTKRDLVRLLVDKLRATPEHFCKTRKALRTTVS